MKALLDWLADHRKRNREAEERREQRLAKRNELQRATLLELQEAAQALGRFAGRVQHEDIMAARKSGTWGTNLVGHEIDEGFRSSIADVAKLRVRTRNQEVQRLASNFAQGCAAIARAESELESARKLSEAMEIYLALTEEIGRTLHSLDDLRD